MASSVSMTHVPAGVPALALAPAPTLAARPSVAPSPGPGTPGSITSKEWVIPPRPKPGRKPATDTPPTKRKAQNRAAQRAFRERRAARVSELEEQMKEIEDSHDVQVASLQQQIGNLSSEVDQCREEMGWWRDRCHALEKEVSIERSAKEALVKEFRSSLTGSNCIEDAFGMPIDTHESSRSRHSPHGVGSPERDHRDPQIKPDPEEMEIDFTAQFSSVPTQSHDQEVSSPPVDPCGFCQDGTPCICAEMAAQEQQRVRNINTFETNRLAPIQSISQFTPPPSEGDVRSEVTLPPISQATNSCANGPGTCAQCQADPRSTLFCKTLAASRSASGTPSGGGCCGGGGKDGGCCMSRNAPATAPKPRNNAAMPSQPPGSKPAPPSELTLSCADAFTTLSRHPNFNRASDEISTWLPKLHTLPDPRQIASPGSRAALEVEAASVMGVLRYFDRRFSEK
ncbi:Putative transcriptional activator [Penicillium digitatum]|uniref:Transcriptional activator n=1 Tax=Penicillium digitatum TaxID=36651 RepID=A0A7T6XKY0_PENDI|nr:Putative transcriptional activator [Penicillium digitatum]